MGLTGYWDAYREAVQSISDSEVGLRAAFYAGRIDIAEFERRIAAVLQRDDEAPPFAPDFDLIGKARR